ncbi:ATP-binding protein [Enhygromyxa salina]|uniref:DNA mismatch repair protein n=1 Tax=Enhygromyxa salina TaxID=215803 RepID=A0A2S9YUM8_9BACT|nr:ATP-binding protein [Enhygromyxa salina]PRQ08796.1 DNA mismatch repair protein [Enhygromyxa salina]
MARKKVSKQVEVAVQKDHLRKLAKTRHPVHAVQELIWNSLDADAKSVEVIIERNLWGGVQRLAVIDDGEGILPGRAQAAFERLGGSWKQELQVTPKGRKLHGQEGKGRFAAFSLGRLVSWDSIAMDDDGDFYSCRVEASGDMIDRFLLAAGPVAKGRQVTVGTKVTVDEIPESVHGLIGEDVITAMHDKFSLYLVKYPRVKMVYDGEAIDPHAAISNIESCNVCVEVDGESVEADVDIVEWKRKGPRGIYLCDSDGFSVQDVPLGKSTHGRRITAHIKSEIFQTLLASGGLSVGDLHPVVRALLNRTRELVGDYYERSSKRVAIERVKGWRDEGVYPFGAAPKGPIETAQQQTFVLVANEVEERVPEVQKHGQKAKRLLFRLLRDAIERGPDQLHVMLAQALELTNAQQQELAELLPKPKVKSKRKPKSAAEPKRATASRSVDA